jgi:hypothetical protein
MWILISQLMAMAIILVSADNADILLEDYFAWKSKMNPEGAYTTGFQVVSIYRFFFKDKLVELTF